VRDAEQPPPFRAPNDVFRYTTKKLFSIAAQYTTSKQAAEPLPALSNREMTPGNSKMMSSNITIQDAKKDARGGKNRWKRHPWWVAAAADYDDNDDKKADGFDMGCITAAACIGKH
jgi:hypothetical protein